jgi:hypothetical protein
MRPVVSAGARRHVRVVVKTMPRYQIRIDVEALNSPALKQLPLSEQDFEKRDHLVRSLKGFDSPPLASIRLAIGACSSCSGIVEQDTSFAAQAEATALFDAVKTHLEPSGHVVRLGG